MENKMVLDVLKECGCIRDGHFLFSSGLHSGRYCQCARLLQYPDKAAEVLALVVEQVKDLGVQMLVGPALGGILVSYEIGRQMELPAIFTERENNIMKLRRNFEIAPGTKVLVTEDVVTTGKSSLETIQVLEELGAEVVGICCIVDRRLSGIELDYPVFSATTMDSAIFRPEECPLCKEGLSLEKPGSRKQ